MTQQTVSGFLALWLDLRAPGLALSTVSGYRRTIDRHVAPVIGAAPLAEISAADVLAVVSPLCSAGHTRAAQLALVLLRAALADAVRMGLIPSNPAAAVRSPHHTAREIRYWDAATVQRFLRASRASPLYCAWLLALCCGLRRGELLGLRWSDVDFGAAVLHVRNQRLTVDGVTVDKPPKSRAGRRDLPLPAPVLEALRAHRRAQSPLSAYVVANARGLPLSAQQLRGALSRACAAAGVPPLHLHGLRHSMATAAIAAGVDVKTLQTILGHAHYSTTADIYAHATDTARALALASLARSVL